MTFWILLTIAGWLSFLSLRHKHLLLSLGACMGWLTLMGYNLSYPPTNIVVGSTLHEWMTMMFIAVSIAVMYIWFRGRKGSETVTRFSAEGEEIVSHSIKREGLPRKGLMELSGEEYRALVHRKLRRRR